ncbi:MAG TPA: polymer-forming cytoskeletal protein [Steroidobacteraceae bacterium]|nr:polymer-forming cytoskeletal protein [Steroidobacteraceae bacterium]
MRNFGFDQRSEAPEPMRAQPSFGAPATHAPQAAPHVEKKVAVLGPTLRFKGELSAEEDFILQGRIEGSIHHTQCVTIGTDGSVLGNINARIITVDGTVEGDLHGNESVVVHATGRVAGNIFAPRVGIVEGAFFNGRIEMPDTKGARAHAPQRPAGVPLSAEETERMLGAKPPGM